MAVANLPMTEAMGLAHLVGVSQSLGIRCNCFRDAYDKMRTLLSELGSRCGPVIFWFCLLAVDLAAEVVAAVVGYGTNWVGVKMCRQHD